MYDDEFVCVACGATYSNMRVRCPFCKAYDTIREREDYESAKESYDRYIDDLIDERRDMA